MSMPTCIADVEAMKAVGADLNGSYPDHPGWTNLHSAAYGPPDAATPVLEALLANGAMIDAVETRTGRTPLHVACQYGHPDAVRLLLAAGADRSIRDYAGSTPHDLAVIFHRGDADADVVVALSR